jgi:phage baseplate assembly protein W
VIPTPLPPLPLVGFPLLPVPDAKGELSFPTVAASVRDAIRVILSTRPGEQLMRPQFGGGLAAMLNRPNTLETRKQIQDLVVESLQRWEPRIVVDRVDVVDVPNAPARLRVEIAYRLQGTGLAQQTGLLMDLAGA